MVLIFIIDDFKSSIKEKIKEVIKDKIKTAELQKLINAYIEREYESEFSKSDLKNEINYNGLSQFLRNSIDDITDYILDFNPDSSERKLSGLYNKAISKASANNKEKEDLTKKFISNAVMIVEDFYLPDLNNEIKFQMKQKSEHHKELIEALNIIIDKINIKAPDEKFAAQLVTIDSAPSPSVFFTGRETELSHIRKSIMENKKAILINGMGGIGKSEICKKLFHDYLETGGEIEYIGWVVFNENLKSSLYGKFKSAKEITDFEENIAQTKIHINELSKKLIVFIDNMNTLSADDKNLLDSLACNFIITSRLNDMGNNVIPVSIGELSENDCIKIYKEILRRSSYNDETVRGIVKKAGFLTILVELLARTAKSAHLSDEKLFEKLNEKGFNLPEIKKSIELKDIKDKFNNHLSKLFDLSLVNKEELLVLKQFSLFPPIPLDYEYADKWFAWYNPDILNELVEKGWLTDSGNGCYMHNVISDVIRYKNAPSYNECSGLIKIMSRDLKYKAGELFTSRLGILPFCEKTAEYFRNIKYGHIDKLMLNIAYIYHNQGEYNKALDYYCLTLTIREKVLGEKHPSSAEVYNQIGLVYYNQTKYDKALELYNQALAVRENILGKEHPYTATTYNCIAGVYSSLGEYEKALEFYLKALTIREKVLGKTHLSTATTYNSIGLIYKAKGEYEKALEFYSKALAIRENKSGKEHPSAATTYNCIAGVYKDWSEYGKALEFYFKALLIRENVLKEHPSTASTYNQIGLVYESCGEYEKALEYYNKALIIREIKLGTSHPSTTETYNCIAGVHQIMGENEKATEFYDKALAVLKNRNTEL